MTLIDGDRIVTAQIYNDEHEEFTEKKMSIIDFVNAYSDEGVTTADDVLDKIRSELIQSIQNGTLKIESGNEELFNIIDKYKAEVRDKEWQI